MVARVLLALLAVLVIGWTAVLLRDYELGHDAALRAFFHPQPPGSARDRDLRHLDDAQLLSPDSYWRLSVASYYLRTGHPGSAAKRAEDVLRGEPDNLTAWGLVLEATSRRRPNRARQAAAEIKRRDPLR